MSKQMKKGLVATMLTILFTAGLAGAASASYYPADITTLAAYLDKSGASYTSVSNAAVSGNLYFTPLAYEADYTNQLKTGSTVLFTNTSLPSEFGSVKQANAASTYFYDTTKGWTFSLYDSSHVDVFKLTKDLTLSGGLTLSAGSFIIGLNDSAGAYCGGDFDDFIVAASKTAPTPLPAAVWILGTGLFGLMGFRRAHRAGSH